MLAESCDIINYPAIGIPFRDKNNKWYVVIHNDALYQLFHICNYEVIRIDANRNFLNLLMGSAIELDETCNDASMFIAKRPKLENYDYLIHYGQDWYCTIENDTLKLRPVRYNGDSLDVDVNGIVWESSDVFRVSGNPNSSCFQYTGKKCELKISVPK